jgi:GNAT superfamily N-acetyltransferase
VSDSSDLAAVVAAASRDWVWVPPDAEDVRTSDYRLTHYPDRSSVQWSRTSRPLAEVLDEVAAQARERGRPVLRWWVHEDTEPGDTEQRLIEARFTHAETVDVLALDLRDGARALVERLAVPADVEVRAADDLAALRLAGEIDSAVFDWAPAYDALLEHEASLAQEGLATGRWSQRRYLALVDGRPQGDGGVGLVPGGPDGGRVARLWGGGVLPGARGRGAYRALLAARLAFAVEQGATLALVKGRVATSAPILRRAGFAGYGQERCYETSVVPGASEPSGASTPR